MSEWAKVRRTDGMLTIAEAAAALGLTVSSVCQAANRGALAAETATVGDRPRRLVPAAAVAAYRARQAGQKKRGPKTGSAAPPVRLHDLAPGATLSVTEAAGRTGRTRRAVLAAIATGALPAARAGGGRVPWRVRAADLAAWGGR